MLMGSATETEWPRGVAGTEWSWHELQEQNDHETNCRNRMIMRRVAGTECSCEELQKQIDHGGVAGTGPSECSPWPGTEWSRDQFKEQNAHGKSYRNRMTTGKLQEQVLLNARPDQEQNDHETSCRNRMLMERATETEWPQGSCLDRMVMRRVEGTECSWVEQQKQNDQETSWRNRMLRGRAK